MIDFAPSNFYLANTPIINGFTVNCFFGIGQIYFVFKFIWLLNSYSPLEIHYTFHNDASIKNNSNKRFLLTVIYQLISCFSQFNHLFLEPQRIGFA